MSETGDSRQQPTEARCYRLHRSYLVLGVFCAALFLIGGGSCTAAAYWNIDGSFARPKLAALIFGTFYSGLTLLGVWFIAAYFREALFLGSDAIVQHGTFRSETLKVGEVTQIRWRIWPQGGSVVACTRSQKVRIYFENFTMDECEEIALYFRKTFPEDIQENWSRFDECVRKIWSLWRLAIAKRRERQERSQS